MHFVIILYYKVGGGKLAFQIKPDRKETEIKSSESPKKQKKLEIKELCKTRILPRCFGI